MVTEAQRGPRGVTPVGEPPSWASSVSICRNRHPVFPFVRTFLRDLMGFPQPGSPLSRGVRAGCYYFCPTPLFLPNYICTASWLATEGEGGGGKEGAQPHPSGSEEEKEDPLTIPNERGRHPLPRRLTDTPVPRREAAFIIR